MSKKPDFSINISNKEKRLLEAKKALEKEEEIPTERTVQTTLLIEASLRYKVTEIINKRKLLGIKPDTVTGIIKEALKEFVEKNT